MTLTDEIAEERLLIKKCLAHDGAGWERLYEHYQPGLLKSIPRRMHGKVHDPNVIEDIAQEVWARLLAKDMRRFRTFDPEHGRLGSYLDLLAHWAVQQFWKERARHKPPARLQDWQAENHGPAAEFEDLRMQEFLGTLSRQERRFCLGCMLGRAGACEPYEFSHEYAQQLTRRVLERWEAFKARDAG